MLSPNRAIFEMQKNKIEVCQFRSIRNWRCIRRTKHEWMMDHRRGVAHATTSGINDQWRLQKESSCTESNNCHELAHQPLISFRHLLLWHAERVPNVWKMGEEQNKFFRCTDYLLNADQLQTEKMRVKMMKKKKKMRSENTAHLQSFFILCFFYLEKKWSFSCFIYSAQTNVLLLFIYSSLSLSVSVCLLFSSALRTHRRSKCIEFEAISEQMWNLQTSTASSVFAACSMLI